MKGFSIRIPADDIFLCSTPTAHKRMERERALHYSPFSRSICTLCYRILYRFFRENKFKWFRHHRQDYELLLCAWARSRSCPAGVPKTTKKKTLSLSSCVRKWPTQHHEHFSPPPSQFFFRFLVTVTLTIILHDDKMHSAAAAHLRASCQPNTQIIIISKMYV